MPKDTSKPEHFKAPASAGKCDIVLVSSDSIKYRLHLKHLEIASELFSSMVDGASQQPGEITIIDLTDKECEKAAVMDLVVPYFYNCKPPKLDDTPDELLVQMMAMSHKWGIFRAHEVAGAELAKRSPDDALDAYCLAIKYEHETLQKAVEVRAAASTRFRKDPVSCIAIMGGKGVVELQMVQARELKLQRMKIDELFLDYMNETAGEGKNQTRRMELAFKRSNIDKAM